MYNHLDSLSVFDDRYIKAKIRIYVGTAYNNFRGLNVPEHGVERESFTVTSINSLLVYDNKYYLQIYLDDYTSTIVNKEMIDYLDENFFETDED